MVRKIFSHKSYATQNFKSVILLNYACNAYSSASLLDGIILLRAPITSRLVSRRLAALKTPAVTAETYAGPNEDAMLISNFSPLDVL